MNEIKNETKNHKDGKNKKEVKHTKVVKKTTIIKKIFYFLFIVVLIIILITLYLKVKTVVKEYTKDLYVPPVATSQNTVDTNQSNTTSENTIVSNEDTINSGILSEYLNKQKIFQEEISKKIEALEKKINENNLTTVANVTSKNNNVAPNNDVSRNNSSIVDVKSTLNQLNKSKQQVYELSKIYQLIIALNQNKAFYQELNELQNTRFYIDYKDKVKDLSIDSSIGIPSNFDLLNSFNKISPKIKAETYKFDDSFLGKLKYHLSFFLVVEKQNSLSTNAVSLDNIFSQIRVLLANNQAKETLILVENNKFCNLQSATSWCKSLMNRTKANNLAQSLQQYLLNSQTMEDK